MNRGIVLRDRRSHTVRFTIFDELQGKIIAYPRQRDIQLRAPSGSLLSYTYSLWRDMVILDMVELKSYPIVNYGGENGYIMLQFVHQVLEVLEAFMPISSPHPLLFEKIFLLYTEQAHYISSTLFKQRVFLCQILAFLGIYPDETTYMCNHDVRYLILSPFEFMVDHEDAYLHDALKLWLYGCLATHPTVSTWKTLR